MRCLRECAVKERLLSAVDLFAGCGGFGLGLEQAGFTPIYVNELNRDARSTYLTNRIARHEWFASGLDKETWLNPYSSADARRIARKEHLLELQLRFRSDFGLANGDIDIVVGGPPCQGFSNIGHRRSYAVQKEELPSNHLYRDMARFIERLRPKAFVFENVRGLLTGRWTSDGEKGEIWEHVKRTFAEIGDYKLAAELVFAKDYGVAQNRPRIILVGIRKDLARDWTRMNELDAIDRSAISNGFLPPGKSGSAPDLIDLLGDLIDPHYENGGKTSFYPSKALSDVQRALRLSADLKHVTGSGEAVAEHDYSKHSPEVVKRFSAMRHGKSYKATKKFAQRVLPRRWGSKGPTITATSLADDYVHFDQDRTLTVREWARLQGFPDWYEFMGKRTTGGLRRAGNPLEGNFERELPKYTQIGNAVPVPLAKAIGEHIKGLLRRLEATK
jgi:DNA (cytosine-5)-methyltransferase 1